MQSWELTQTELIRTVFKRFAKDGVIEGEDAASILMSSRLHPSVLSRIFDLSDKDNDGKLTEAEFIVAFHLCTCVGKRGLPLPTELPEILERWVTEQKGRRKAKFTKGARVIHHRQSDGLQREGRVVGVHADDIVRGYYYTVRLINDASQELQANEERLSDVTERKDAQAERSGIKRPFEGIGQLDLESTISDSQNMDMDADTSFGEFTSSEPLPAVTGIPPPSVLLAMSSETFATSNSDLNNLTIQQPDQSSHFIELASLSEHPLDVASVSQPENNEIQSNRVLSPVGLTIQGFPSVSTTTSVDEVFSPPISLPFQGFSSTMPPAPSSQELAEITQGTTDNPISGKYQEEDGSEKPSVNAETNDFGNSKEMVETTESSNEAPENNVEFEFENVVSPPILAVTESDHIPVHTARDYIDNENGQVNTGVEQFNNENEQFTNGGEQFNSENEQLNPEVGQLHDVSEQFNPEKEQFNNEEEEFNNESEQLNRENEKFNNRGEQPNSGNKQFSDENDQFQNGQTSRMDDPLSSGDVAGLSVSSQSEDTLAAEPIPITTFSSYGQEALSSFNEMSESGGASLSSENPSALDANNADETSDLGICGSQSDPPMMQEESAIEPPAKVDFSMDDLTAEDMFPENSSSVAKVPSGKLEFKFSDLHEVTSPPQETPSTTSTSRPMVSRAPINFKDDDDFGFSTAISAPSLNSQTSTSKASLNDSAEIVLEFEPSEVQTKTNNDVSNDDGFGDFTS